MPKPDFDYIQFSMALPQIFVPMLHECMAAEWGQVLDFKSAEFLDKTFLENESYKETLNELTYRVPQKDGDAPVYVHLCMTHPGTEVPPTLADDMNKAAVDYGLFFTPEDAEEPAIVIPVIYFTGDGEGSK